MKKSSLMLAVWPLLSIWDSKIQPAGAGPINYGSFQPGAPYYGRIRYRELTIPAGDQILVGNTGVSDDYDLGDIDLLIQNVGISIDPDDVKYQAALCFIGDQESMIFQPIWNNMYLSAANTPDMWNVQTTITPQFQGLDFTPDDMLSVYIRRQTDSAQNVGLHNIKLSYNLI